MDNNAFAKNLQHDLREKGLWTTKLSFGPSTTKLAVTPHLGVYWFSLTLSFDVLELVG